MSGLSSRRSAVLREMGLGPLWRLRSRWEAEQALLRQSAQSQPETTAAVTDRLPHRSAAAVDARSGAELARSPTLAPVAAGGARPSVAREQRARTVLPQTTDAGARASLPTMLDPAVAAERAQRIARLSWDELDADIRDCRACPLHAQRRQAVPGAGDRNARWLMLGEGPGREEDARGEPFVGPAGQLLDKMLAAIGLHRGEDVYIANAVKCRPPYNRIPEAGEIAACRPYLLRQLALLKPELIFVMGRPAAYSVLEREVNISNSRGRLIEHQGQQLVISYHPAYLLRNPQDKGKAWADLCLAHELMAGSGREPVAH